MEVLQRTANRGSVSTGNYEIDNSLKFEADNTEYMHYTPSGQTDYERMAFSVWVKRTELSTAQLIMEFGNGTANTSNLRIGFDTSDRLFCYGNSIIWRQTNQVFRDTAAWYHLFFLFDTTTPGGVSNNRIRIWVNGSMIDHGDFGTINNPGSGSSMGFNNSLKQSLGRQTEDATSYFCGYMAQVYGSGGTPPVVGDFGETDSDTGIWIPKDISGITPPDAAGFNLDFSNSSSLGNDISSRNNDFTLVNIAAADQSTDTPTNNFCTWNPLYAMTYPMTISEGGTKTTANGSVAQWQSSKASMAVNNGKWYWETSNFTELNTFIGIQSADANTTYGVPYSWNLPLNDNSFYIVDPNGRTESFATTKATTDVWAIALNMDDGEISFYRNGTQQNSTVSIDGLIGNGPYVAIISQYASAGTCSTNFGGYNSGKAISSAASDANGYGTFEYAPPTGYYAICTKNLAEYG
jgi:hypothetical protein